jgi:beta-lactam-binding protein with PASTA domain/predicted Ser/Thr protein kinase
VDTTLHDPLIGRLLDGRYRVEQRIAAGGMATVYRGVDTRLERSVALKVMHASLAADPEFTARFMREAKAVARLAHPNVVNVFDQGEDAGAVFLAMEYVPGLTLRDLLRERGALSPRTALDILEPVLAALGAAHRAGLVHRDVKPENVLLTDGGLVKVADFGLVRAVAQDTSSTSAGQLLGTVSYLAPEQIERGAADPRCDVYEMLTGGKPHPGENPMQIIYRHLNEDVPPPSADVPGLAPELDAVTAAATARAPERRPADAVELLARVQRCRRALTPAQLDAEPPEHLRPAPSEHTTVLRGATGSRAAASRSGATTPQAGPEKTSILPPGMVMPRHERYDEPTVQRPRRRRPRWLPLAVLGVLAAGLVVGLTLGLSSALYTTMPAVLSLPVAQAEQKLSADGLSSSVQQQFSDTVPKGDVISTDPSPGSRVRSDSTVTLVVSQGPERDAVPAVAGQPLARAEQQITAAHLAVGTVTQAYNGSVPAGEVIASDPVGGQQLRPGTPVSLVVSQGAQPAALPSVVGLPVAQAQQQLAAAGFTVQIDSAQVFSDTVPAGQVAQQSPSGSTAPRGSTVTLTLSKGPQLFPVPDVTGQKLSAAQAALEAAGFKVSVVTLNPLVNDPTVHDESPQGNSQKPKGTQITLIAF